MKLRFLFIFLFTITFGVSAAKYNAYGLKFYTLDTDHFLIHYMDGTGHLANKVACKFEELYSIYRNTYNITLPNKTNVMILDSDESNGWAFSNINTITIWTHDFDFNLRGSHDWFDDVIAHEFAHIVSISSSYKTTPVIPEFRVGYFSHPNEKNRTEAIHSFPTDILPRWFSEGIAQYESSRHGADTWDSHRDMILRTLVLSDKLLSWDQMQVFTGRGDDYEKTYNHGFSLVKYIAETYGYDNIAAMCRASSKLPRLTFDKAIKEVLGISGRQLYAQWKKHLETIYTADVKNIGTQVYGNRINKYGYENFWPQFTPDGKGIFFLSNGKYDYGRKSFCQYSLSDTVKEDNKIKVLSPIGAFYSISSKTGKICYTSGKSSKSTLPAKIGGTSVRDIFIDTIPSDKKKNGLFQRKKEKQITFKKDIFNAVFSPDGKYFACAQREVDKFKLVMTDTSGKVFKTLYPVDTSKNDINFIYTIDWAPDGKRIAFSFFDQHDRKVAIYDTLTKQCTVVCNTDNDERDPRFSPDGKHLYFSSDRSGIFNIYRYEFSSGKLEQITNVTGGAFAPSISPDNNQLVYAGYDRFGYSIYHINKIATVKSIQTDTSALAVRQFTDVPTCTLSLSPSRKYSRIPHQFMFVPTFFAEQSASRSDNVNEGVTIYKTGFIFNLFEPLTLSGMGNEIDGYFLIEPKHLFDFIDLNRGFFNPDASYDIGLMGSTQVLPFRVSCDYGIRGIAGVDSFFNEYSDSTESLPYNYQMQNLNLQISHIFGKNSGSVQAFQDALSLHLLLSGNITNVNLLLDGTTDFKYTLDEGFRIGLMGTSSAVKMNSRSVISPEGHTAKLQYTFNTKFALKEENSFNNKNQERFDRYNYHELRGHIKTGLAAPWHPKHDFHIDLNGATIRNIKKNEDIPSYLLPGAWIPGYTYYYRDIKNKPTNTNEYAKKTYDTLTITGNTVFSGEISYRFPLWPGLIDKKIGFIYLERLYAGINAGAGTGLDRPSDVFNIKRNNLLAAYGCELRLEAKTFSSYPLAVKLRWDRGIDRKAPIGGDHFTFSLGYDFDNWGTVLSPDYRSARTVR